MDRQHPAIKLLRSLWRTNHIRLFNIGKNCHITRRGAPQCSDPMQRVTPLENLQITWLQDQHCNMVAALHSEIDTLKHKNKGD